jgi:cell division protein FtsB
MAQQRKQHLNKRERRALVRILSAAALLCLLLLCLAPGCSLRSYFSVKEKAAALAQKDKWLRQEIEQINKEIKLLQQDSRYLEKIAREQYGMLKKNEELYLIAPPVKNKE